MEIGIKAAALLVKLGYQVEVPEHEISGRTYFSKGLIKEAKEFAVSNVNLLKDIINEKTPLIGIEPSAILSFRDEYPDLVGKELKEAAIELGKSALMFDEFIASEIDKGNISKSSLQRNQEGLSFTATAIKKRLPPSNPQLGCLPCLRITRWKKSNRDAAGWPAHLVTRKSIMNFR